MSDQGLRLMVYDNTDSASGLSQSWFAGGHLYRWVRRLDSFKGFGTWSEALTWLNEVEPDRKIQQIQFWGHGSPGRVFIGQEALRARSFQTGQPHAAQLLKLARRLTPESTVWFRTCATFAGQPGHDFAQVWSQSLGCRVAAHTHNIGFWQSGLHTVEPGDLPDWSVDEGVAAADDGKPTKLQWSYPWSPRTITCLRGTIPTDW